MESCRVGSCLGCCSVKRGVQCCGVFKTWMGLLLLAQVAFQHDYPTAVLGFLFVCMGVLLLLAATKEDPLLLKVWLAFDIALVSLSQSALLIGLALGAGGEDEKPHRERAWAWWGYLLVGGSWSLGFAFWIYSWIVVYSLLQEIKERNKYESQLKQ